MLRRWFAAGVVALVAGISLPSVPASAGGYRRGRPVTLNRDPTAHMVAWANASWGSYEELAKGASVSFAFEAPGVYPHCFLHVGMIGAVVVGDGRGPWAASKTGAAVVPHAVRDRREGRSASRSAWRSPWPAPPT